MTYLLDTHVWVWALEEPEKLGSKARSVLQDLDNVRLLSAISALEIARWIYFGKLHFSQPLSDWIHASMRALMATAIDLTPAVAVEAYSLPGHLHQDPADRILVASARLSSATLVTADKRLLNYKHVRTMSAT
jgi:PIN domain nuclease of toxin-antitoxin system